MARPCVAAQSEPYEPESYEPLSPPGGGGAASAPSPAPVAVEGSWPCCGRLRWAPRRALDRRRLGVLCGLLAALPLAALLAARGGGGSARPPGHPGARAPSADAVDLFSLAEEAARLASHFGLGGLAVPEAPGQTDLLTLAQELNETLSLQSRQLPSRGRGRPGVDCIPRAVTMAMYFAFAGLNTDTAVKTCQRLDVTSSGDNSTLPCAITAQYAASAFAWAGYFLAGTIDSCSGGRLTGAGCATSSMEMVAALLDMSSRTTAAVGDCKTTSGSFHTSQLREFQYQPPSGYLYDGYCALDIMLTISWLVHAAIEIASLVGAGCTPGAAEEHCAAAILDIIATFGYATSYISDAVTDCGKDFNVKAACAADIAQVVAAASLAGSSGIGLSTQCSKEKERQNEEEQPDWMLLRSGDAGR